MTLLVDECRWLWRDRHWCHLVSDQSHDELHAFARRLGVPRRAFQGDHYDLHEDLRVAAVALGARPVDSRELLARLRAAGLRERPSARRARTPLVHRLDPSAWLGQMVTVIVDRPLGSWHAYGGFAHALNVGEVPGVTPDVYLVGPDVPVASGTGPVHAVVHRPRDVVDALVVALGDPPPLAELASALAATEAIFDSRLHTAAGTMAL